MHNDTNVQISLAGKCEKMSYIHPFQVTKYVN